MVEVMVIELEGFETSFLGNAVFLGEYWGGGCFPGFGVFPTKESVVAREAAGGVIGGGFARIDGERDDEYSFLRTFFKSGRLASIAFLFSAFFAVGWRTEGADSSFSWKKRKI